MKKIIFITNFLGNGGAARVMSVLANYLEDNDIDIEILSFLDMDGKYKVNENVKYSIIKCKSKNNVLKKLERILKLRKLLKKSSF